MAWGLVVFDSGCLWARRGDGGPPGAGALPDRKNRQYLLAQSGEPAQDVTHAETSSYLYATSSEARVRVDGQGGEADSVKQRETMPTIGSCPVALSGRDLGIVKSDTR